jgi:AcrR family transcriptional regulator
MAEVKIREAGAAAGRRRQVKRSDKPEGELAPDKHDIKSQMILAAAAKIFNARGFHNTSVTDVAEVLGVSKPFLYYYLKNKDYILFECSRIATEALHAMLDEVRKADVNSWERLVLIFKGYARVMTSDFGICLIRNTAPGSLPETSREKLWVGRRRLNREVEQVIAQGIADGSIRRCDPITLSFAIFGAFNWITYWYRDNGPLTPDEISERFLDVFANGVKGSSAHAAPSNTEGQG